MKYLKHTLLMIVLIGVAALISLTRTALAAEDDTPRPLYLPMMVQQPAEIFSNPGPDWLVYLNDLRTVGNLPPLVENSGWSEGCDLHTRYMIKNDVMEHQEDPQNPWYTPEGAAAAGNSNLMMSTNAALDDFYAIDLWLTGPFHGLGLLDPELLSTGFGSYREALGTWRMGACLDVLRGLGSTPASVNFPIQWPAPGRVMPYLDYNGSEFPNPLSSCPGYTAPSGPPIYLQLGSGSLTPAVTAHSLTTSGQPVEHCVFDESTYQGDFTEVARSVLNARDAVILLPRHPLTPGASYTVSITANGQIYTWSFTATNAARSPQTALPAEVLTGLLPEAQAR
jgi:hypothetical protein